MRVLARMIRGVRRTCQRLEHRTVLKVAGRVVHDPAQRPTLVSHRRSKRCRTRGRRSTREQNERGRIEQDRLTRRDRVVTNERDTSERAHRRTRQSIIATTLIARQLVVLLKLISELVRSKRIQRRVRDTELRDSRLRVNDRVEERIATLLGLRLNVRRRVVDRDDTLVRRVTERVKRILLSTTRNSVHLSINGTTERTIELERLLVSPINRRVQTLPTDSASHDRLSVRISLDRLRPIVVPLVLTNRKNTRNSRLERAARLATEPLDRLTAHQTGRNNLVLQKLDTSARNRARINVTLNSH